MTLLLIESMSEKSRASSVYSGATMAPLIPEGMASCGAHVFGYLASEEARFVTRVVICHDGDWAKCIEQKGVKHG